MAISELETKILKVAAEHAGKRLSVEQLASEVGCQPGTIYMRLQDQEFRDLFRETMSNSLVADVPETLNAFAKMAKRGEFKHGELLLKITGVYQDKKEIRADIGLREGESPFRSDEDRRAFIQATLSEFVSGSPEGGEEEDD